MKKKKKKIGLMVTRTGSFQMPRPKTETNCIKGTTPAQNCNS